MKSLLIDTSNQMLSIAINEDKILLAEINTNVKVNHSETLMVYLDDLFRAARVKKSEIDRIIVARARRQSSGKPAGNADPCGALQPAVRVALAADRGLPEAALRPQPT